MNKITRFSLVLLVLCMTAGIWAWQSGLLFKRESPRRTFYMKPSADAKWPWEGATTKTVARGVQQTTKTTGDGTTLDLLDFDFGVNPKLRFEIFDQDEDDAKPLDNRVLWDKCGAVDVARKIDAEGKGKVIAAWNGAFFGYDKKANPMTAFHVSPVILRGEVLFNNAQHRWTFGVKNTPDGPVWKAIFKPSRPVMQQQFDYGAGSVQYLIQNGEPLDVEPFPKIGEAFKKQPVASTERDAGHIPYFDHMRTCRASIGWSRDNRHLYLLAVKEPDAEGSSSVALSFAVRGEEVPANNSLKGGWTVPDVQKFWESKGVWGAVNSDAGDIMQLAVAGKNGSFDFIPPRLGSDKMRMNVPAGATSTTKGGAIMYFYIREIP